MRQHTPEEYSAGSTGWSTLAIIGNTMPPRNPDEDGEDEEEEEEEHVEEPPVVREPDED